MVDPDSRFIFAPSWFNDDLAEGKSIGTADLDDLALLQDIARKKDHNLVQFAKERKTGSGVGKRKLKQVQQRTEAGLRKLIDQWDDQELDEKQFRKQATKLMRQAWRDVFLAGVRAGGTKSSGLRGKDDPMALLGPGDDKWLKSAVRHEMGFFNKLLDAIVTNDYVMPIPRRVKMYVKALDSFYDSARIISLPKNVIIHWAGPRGANMCPSCEFLFDNSPYTAANLPTTPRSGATMCLTNCRDWLYIRRVPPKKAKEVLEGAKYKRSGLIKKLRKIKRVGHP
jgi:hypothetical protein